MEVLSASNKKFNCTPSRVLNTLSFQEIILREDSDWPNLKEIGFLVIKDVLPKQDINKARDTYFSLFKNGEYEKLNNKWIHLNNHMDPHGCNNHPSKEFLKKEQFLKIIFTEKLNYLTKKILRTEDIILSPRRIVRSFSNLSSRCTLAHRDKEYFLSKNSNNVMTCWIPLGPVGPKYGQLIYLKDSHKKEEIIDKLVTNEKLISKDLDKLSKDLNLNWVRPIIEEGDIIFHSLEIVHSSFDSFSNIPRLSIDLRYSSSLNDHDPRWSSPWRGDDGL